MNSRNICGDFLAGGRSTARKEREADKQAPKKPINVLLGSISRPHSCSLLKPVPSTLSRASRLEDELRAVPSSVLQGGQNPGVDVGKGGVKKLSPALLHNNSTGFSPAGISYRRKPSRQEWNCGVDRPRGWWELEPGAAGLSSLMVQCRPSPPCPPHMQVSTKSICP